MCSENSLKWTAPQLRWGNCAVYYSGWCKTYLFSERDEKLQLVAQANTPGSSCKALISWEMRRAAPRAECKEREKIKLVHAQVIKASACTRAVTTHIFICHLMRGKKSIEPFILCARVRWNRITRWLQDWVASARKTRHFKGYFQRPGTKQTKKNRTTALNPRTPGCVKFCWPPQKRISFI